MSLFNRPPISPAFNFGGQGSYTPPAATPAPAPVPAKVEQKPNPRARGPSFKNPTQLVTLEFGPDKVKFIVHKEFACYYSPVLKAALNNDVFVEGRTQRYTLEEPSENTGRLLVHWFYVQDLTILDREDWGLHGTKEEDMALVQLWILADKLLIPRLQNQVLRKINELQKKGNDLPAGVLLYVYDNTTKGSPLRKFLVHLCACFMGSNVYSERSKQFPNEMLLELAETYASKLEASYVVNAVGLKTNWAQYEVAENGPSSKQ